MYLRENIFLDDTQKSICSFYLLSRYDHGYYAVIMVAKRCSKNKRQNTRPMVVNVVGQEWMRIAQALKSGALEPIPISECTHCTQAKVNTVNKHMSYRGVLGLRIGPLQVLPWIS